MIIITIISILIIIIIVIIIIIISSEHCVMPREPAPPAVRKISRD